MALNILGLVKAGQNVANQVQQKVAASKPPSNFADNLFKFVGDGGGQVPVNGNIYEDPSLNNSWRNDPRANDPNWHFDTQGGWRLKSWQEDPRAKDPNWHFDVNSGWSQKAPQGSITLGNGVPSSGAQTLGAAAGSTPVDMSWRDQPTTTIGGGSLTLGAPRTGINTTGIQAGGTRLGSWDTSNNTTIGGSSFADDLWKFVGDGANSQLPPGASIWEDPEGVAQWQAMQGQQSGGGTGGQGILGQVGGGAAGGGAIPDQARLQSGFKTQRDTFNSSLQSLIGQTGQDYRQGILNLIDSLKSGQLSIDRKGIQNELSRKQASQGILGMVGRGIQSGGVQLANRNAGDSSGKEAIARAYSQLGQSEMAGVNNQFNQNEYLRTQDQLNFNEQQAGGLRNLEFDKQKVINNVVAHAQSKFAELDAAMVNAGIPDRIAIEQEKERVRQEILGVLNGFDAELSQGRESAKPVTPEFIRSEANRLATTGAAADNPFNFSTNVPAQFQGTGPFASSLPIFTFGRGRRTA